MAKKAKMGHPKGVPSPGSGRKASPDSSTVIVGFRISEADRDVLLALGAGRSIHETAKALVLAALKG